MFGTLKTLVIGAQARAEDHVRDVYAVELIEQKIREAQAGLQAAKHTLASLIQRMRSEDRLASALQTRIEDLMARAAQALQTDRAALAQEAAQAIADMENELKLRRETIDRLETRIMRLRASIETANRRVVDLKQGATAAKAVKREHEMQARLGRTVAQGNAMDEADALIQSVLGRDDPFEQREILEEIDEGLSHDGLAERMAAAGLGPSSKITASDVLSRLS